MKVWEKSVWWHVSRLPGSLVDRLLSALNFLVKVSLGLVTNKRVMTKKTVKTLSWHLQISHISCNFVSVSVEIHLKWSPIAMHAYLQQALSRVVIHHTQVVEKKWKLRVRFSPTKENRVHQTKISTKTDKDGFSPAVFRSRLNKIFPLLNFWFGAFVFCFLWRNIC